MPVSALGAERSPCERLPQTEMIGARLDRSEEVGAFFRALRASRLLSEAEARELEREHGAAPDRSLADLLVQTGRLTTYQFERVYRGEQAGLVVGPYVVLDEIGRGGGGRVYKARHAVMGRTVALKVIDPKYSEGRAARDLFRREVAAAGRLSHPNVAQIYDANESDGLLYLAMEFVPGPTLHRHTAEAGPLSPEVACAALRQVAEALQHAHEKGLVHRDVKPANVMFPGGRPGDGAAQPGELVKVLDFGLARLGPYGDQRLTTIHCPAGAAIGTPAFMSPEQIRNVHATDIRSDRYSLGCTFYFALSGRLPFDAQTTRVTLMMHLEQEPPPLQSVRPAVPFGLARIVHRLMAKNPADRYQTPADLVAALDALVFSGAFGEDEAPAPVATFRASEELRAPPAALPLPPPAPVGNVVLSATVLTTLRRLWLRWCMVVEGRVHGEPRSVSDARYAELYQALVDAIGRATGAPGLTADRQEQLRAVVEPWVTLQSLRRLDRAALADLWRLCQEAEASFTRGESPRPAGTRLAVRFVAVCSLVAALGWLVPRWGQVLSALGDLTR